MSDDRQVLVAQLKKVTQEFGVLKFKLKGRKDEKDEFKSEINALKIMIESQKSDLKLIRKCNDTLYNQNVTLKRAFEILNLTNGEREQFDIAMKHGLEVPK